MESATDGAGTSEFEVDTGVLRSGDSVLIPMGRRMVSGTLIEIRSTPTPSGQTTPIAAVQVGPKVVHVFAHQVRRG